MRINLQVKPIWHGDNLQIEAERKMEYIGLLGCGSIGSSLANSIVTKSINGASLLVIFDQDIEKARKKRQQQRN